jgi:P27 family predicted phage terminase small subunit
MMPNPPKSAALRLLQGNPGHRPISEDIPEPEKGIPDMPSWLEAFPIAVSEWKRESKILNDVGILTIADGPLLANRAYQCHLIQTLAMDIKHEGSVITSQYYKNGDESVIVIETKANPKMIQLQNAMKEHRLAGNVLGLDPSGRTRLHTGKASKSDPFDEFNKR